MFVVVFLTSFSTCVLQGKLLGEQWKKISDGDKAKFEKKAEEDKKRYQKEMVDYTPPSDDDDSDDGGGKKKAMPEGCCAVRGGTFNRKSEAGNGSSLPILFE